MNQPSALPDVDLKQAIGLGVAGNFAGHLEQAGEASDFVAVKADVGKPKGVFPFFLPGPGDSFLHTFPLSADTIEHPGTIAGRPAQLQIEPELALLCRLTYSDDGAVVGIEPTYFTAYNDCSTRRPDATKISQKKNWGPATKGLASDQWIALDRFASGGLLDRFRLACFLKRDGKLLAYGEDSPVAGSASGGGYGTMYGDLLDWLVDRLNHQTDEGPLENMGELIAAAGRPAWAVISIGATRYTKLGETTFLEPGDESIVVVYDQAQHNPTSIPALLEAQAIDASGQTCSVLRQHVVARPATPRV